MQVAAFNNRMEAEMWADVLRQAGIIAMIVPQATAIGSFGTSMYFGHALRVRVGQADRALGGSIPGFLQVPQIAS